MFSFFGFGFIELGEEPHVSRMVHVPIAPFSAMAISTFPRFLAETIGSNKEATPKLGTSKRRSGLSNNDQASVRIEGKHIKRSFAM